MANEILNAVMISAYPWVRLGMFAFIGMIITVIGVYIILEKKKRKWKVELHEMKADGLIHTVGYDKLIERKLKMGTKTIYWLKKAKAEVIPPPDECVDRFSRKEEVDYLRMGRDYIPIKKRVNVNYNSPFINKRVVAAYDSIREKIREIKTTFFDSEPVRDRWIYVPMKKTLTATVSYEPIEYDMNMMAINEIHNADEFYESKYEFWKKYGAIIIFAATIVFLIVIVVLTYEYMNETVMQMLGKVDSTTGVLQQIADQIAGKPPS